MNIKQFLLATGITSILFFSPTIAFAATGGNLDLIKSRCDSAISQRLTTLNDMTTKVNAMKRLSSDEKNNFISQINTDISALNSLKTKCDADTDVTTARADYRSVFTTYRIYAVFAPKTRLFAAADAETTTYTTLQDLYSKLQTRVQEQSNPSSLTSLLSDMEAKLSDASTQYTNAESSLNAITPDSYNANPSGTTATLQQSRSQIKAGAQDLKAALQDARQIRSGLKPLATPTP